MRLILTPNAEGVLVLSAEEEAPKPIETIETIETIVPRPAFFNEQVPFTGYCAGFTWADMCRGSRHGGRIAACKWAMLNGPRPKSPRYSAITEETVARAKVVLAVQALKDAVETAGTFDW